MTSETSPGVNLPDISTGQNAEWETLNREAGGHQKFRPLTIKAAYVFGIVHDICESVDWLLKHPKAWPMTYLLAFGVCASGIELLGRCLRGNPGTGENSIDLGEGFDWLRSSSPKPGAPPSAITVTNYTQYDRELLITLRHFTLHGQATKQPRRAIAIDIELLDAFPWLIGGAMDRYWSELLNPATVYPHNLANAAVFPLRSDPIRKIWEFWAKGLSAGAPFRQFNWHVYR